jgi:tetratricopeptide (TPR) repeat protein
MNRRCRIQACAAAALIAVALNGCLGAQIKANQQQLVQQQTQIDQLKQQIAALQTTRASYASAAPPPGGCDEVVLREASRKGGERFAANEFPQALAYYQDAVTACPGNARAELNLARTLEASGDRSEALAHYKLAADASGPRADEGSAAQAHDALARLQK